MNNLQRKRVRVCKNALAQIRAGRLRPIRGFYINIRANALKDDLKSQLKGVKCDVCATGALLVARVLLNDNVEKAKDIRFDLEYLSYKDYYVSYDDPTDKLTDLWSIEELKNIEAAFEGFGQANQEFFYRYKTIRGRLIGILNNMIKNNGSFLP